MRRLLLASLALVACAPAAPPPEVALPPPAPAAQANVAASSPIRSSPELLALRDPRSTEPMRARRVLVTELQGMESLFADMAKDAPDRPALMRRLASAYWELARVAAADIPVLQARPGAEDEAKKADVIHRAAQSAAVKYYTALAQRYPGWCATPDANEPRRSVGCSDEAWYYAGYGHEALGKLDQARYAYLQAVRMGESRRFVSYAYLAFGELFLPEAETDPSRWELARQSFEEVVKVSLPENEIYAYALLRIGQIHLRRGDRSQAHEAFAKLRALASQRPAPAHADVAARLLPPGE